MARKPKLPEGLELNVRTGLIHHSRATLERFSAVVRRESRHLARIEKALGKPSPMPNSETG